ncbi:MAG: aminotransferase class III-fold pyridoxal phosphate-dependent enzyme [Bacteroidetes bacterium]|nr:MAG: aminotransferase class III-fold pyridoxal phosphate-dependent enzyme [Bacteroidota bacterium]
MNLFDVYPLFDVEPVRAKGCYVYDAQGTAYLDLYGGHAVISIGHSHPHYVARLTEQLNRIGFYSNSVQNRLQRELAEKLGQLSGYPDYQLFLINSGAEAIENALKLASFHTRRKKIAFLEGAFHGRTSAAVAVTDNPRIQAPVNPVDHVSRVGFNDLAQLESLLDTEAYAAVVIEGIQGVGGIHVPAPGFLKGVRSLCDATGTVMILDEIQSGYGRSGHFFAHQATPDLRPDLITVAKGMANGFPMGGVLIGPQFQAWPGMLGTTFGGNHLACAAGLAVLDVIEQEDLIAHAARMGDWMKEALAGLPGVTEVRGAGLMLGVQLAQPAGPLRKALLAEHHIFTGSAADPHTLRLLPPLTVTQEALTRFLEAFRSVLAAPAAG